MMRQRVYIPSVKCGDHPIRLLALISVEAFTDAC
jgi:hypothetical protein